MNIRRTPTPHWSCTEISSCILWHSNQLISRGELTACLQATTQWPVWVIDFQIELLPLHSPLLRESLLVSFPPLINMLKFRGYSRSIWDLNSKIDLGLCKKMNKHHSPLSYNPSPSHTYKGNSLTKNQYWRFWDTVKVKLSTSLVFMLRCKLYASS